MMSRFPFEPKISGAASSASAGLTTGAFASEAGPKAARTAAELKRSFASMLGQVKKEAPPLPSAAAAVKSPQGSGNRHQAQQSAEGIKSKASPSARSNASDTRARSTRDPNERVDNSDEQELTADLTADEQDKSAVVSSDSGDNEGFAPAWVPPLLPAEEAPPVNLCAIDTPFESASLDAEAAVPAINVEASPSSVLGADSVRASAQAMPAIVNQNEIGREIAVSAAFAAEQSPAMKAPATQASQTEGLRMNSNDQAESKAVNANVETPTQQDAAGAFKLPAGLSAVTAQPAPTLAAASLPRSLRAEKTAALSSAPSVKGAENTVTGVLNSIEKNSNQLLKKVDAVVGPTSANNDSTMSSTLLDFTAASPSDAPAAEAVTRVNLVQVVDEVAAITEKMKLSGQQRCIVDLDVSGHGKLRVEVVRRADQVETMLSTDSTSLRESLQAAFDRADRPVTISTSFQWQGSADTSGRGQNGAQADADARQNTYFKAEPAARVGRIPSLPVVPVAPVAAPVLAANHRLQIFA